MKYSSIADCDVIPKLFAVFEYADQSTSDDLKASNIAVYAIGKIIELHHEDQNMFEGPEVVALLVRFIISKHVLLLVFP